MPLVRVGRSALYHLSKKDAETTLCGRLASEVIPQRFDSETAMFLPRIEEYGLCSRCQKAAIREEMWDDWIALRAAKEPPNEPH